MAEHCVWDLLECLNGLNWDACVLLDLHCLTGYALQRPLSDIPPQVWPDTLLAYQGLQVSDAQVSHLVELVEHRASHLGLDQIGEPLVGMR